MVWWEVRMRILATIVATALSCVAPACAETQRRPDGDLWDGGIGSSGHDDDGSGDSDGGVPDGKPGDRAQLRRLTSRQLVNTIEHALGSGVTISGPLEPDVLVELFSTIGASHVQTSELGAEQYLSAIAEATTDIMADPQLRGELVPCDPSAAACREMVLQEIARRAWRRPLDIDELQPFTMLANENLARFSDPWKGLEVGIQAVLGSPRTLYLVELGEPDPADEGRLRYTSIEMASRLSYFLWNGPPDDELMAAAERGELVEGAKVRTQAERMVDDPRVRRGLLRFFEEYLGLDVLSTLSKDPEAFPSASPALFESMRQEVVSAVEHVVFVERGTWSDVLDGSTAWVDPSLAALYGLTYPGGASGHVAVPTGDARRGLLGMGAFLASQSHRTRTSPTARGVWIQARLRCTELPPPPVDVDTSIPDAVPDEPTTMREQLEQHRNDPACASCHALVDPVGLALEHFDALGAHRATDAGLPIDASGSLGETSFEGLAGLATVLRDDPVVAECLVRQLYRYAGGHVESVEEQPYVRALTSKLVDAELGILDFLPELVSSPGFRQLATK